MIALAWLAGFFALVLGFANGANDNAKGVATLIGGGSVRFRPAIMFAAIATFLGSLAAIFLAGELTKRFGGKGIVDAELVGNLAFPVCVGVASALTVLLATRLALPISTTHSIVGAMVGIGFSAGALHVGAAIRVFFLPLLISPLIALVLAAAAYVFFRAIRRASGITEQTCFCVGKHAQPVALTADGVMVMASTGVALSAEQVEQCETRYVGRFIGIDAHRVLDLCHLFSAGALSFARGLNDTPKIAALMIAAGLVANGAGAGASAALLTTGLAIALGGLLAVRRVARTMSYRITGMNDGQGFTANFISALLVIFASRLGVPVSTTHVTCGSLFGIGAVNRRAHGAMIGRVLLAWVTTLPLAALLGGGAWRVLNAWL